MLAFLETLAWCYLFCGLVLLVFASSLFPGIEPGMAFGIVLLWPLFLSIAFIFIAAAAGAQ